MDQYSSPGPDPSSSPNCNHTPPVPPLKAAKRAAAAATAVPPLESFELEELSAAAALLEAEVAFVRKAMGHGATGAEEYMDAWHTAHRDLMWVPSKGRYDRAASATAAERIESTKVWERAAMEWGRVNRGVEGWGL